MTEPHWPDGRRRRTGPNAKEADALRRAAVDEDGQLRITSQRVHDTLLAAGWVRREDYLISMAKYSDTHPGLPSTRSVITESGRAVIAEDSGDAMPKRDLCAVCGTNPTLKLDGRFRQHSRPATGMEQVESGVLRMRCEGTNELPDEVRRAHPEGWAVHRDAFRGPERRDVSPFHPPEGATVRDQYPELFGVLVPIPLAKRQRLTFDMPQFVSWGSGWALIGPDTALPVGERVEVERRMKPPVVVVVGKYVAEYTVHRQEGSYLYEIGQRSVRYVIAKIAGEEH